MKSIRSPLNGFKSPMGRRRAGFSVSIGAGDAITGQELTATVSGLQGGEIVTYQWTADGVDIPAATASTYTPTIGA